MKQSGSEKLVGRSTILDAKLLAKVADVSASHGRIIDWCQYGQPGIDGFCGTVAIDPDKLGSLVKDLINVEDIRLNFNIFPNGVPRPDILHVEFGNQSRESFRR